MGIQLSVQGVSESLSEEVELTETRESRRRQSGKEHSRERSNMCRGRRSLRNLRKCRGKVGNDMGGDAEGRDETCRRLGLFSVKWLSGRVTSRCGF